MAGIILLFSATDDISSSLFEKSFSAAAAFPAAAAAAAFPAATYRPAAATAAAAALPAAAYPPAASSLCLGCHWSIQCLSFEAALVAFNKSTSPSVALIPYIAIRTLSIGIPWFRLGVDHDHHHHQREQHEGGH